MPAQLGPASRTAQGYLRTQAAIAVPGIMEYEDAAGNIVRELISREELHNADSLMSLAGLPVTLGHPDEDVSPENVGTLGVGTMGNDVEILEESGHVRILLMVHRGDALQAIEDGTEEVSPGYTTVIDPTPGEHPIFGKYDAAQTKRRYNHLALVDEARGGSTVKLRADGARRAVHRMDALPTSTPTPTPTPAPAYGGKAMHSLILIAAMCGLSFDHRGDGAYYRQDAGEGEGAQPVSEEQLVGAITDAIRGLQGQVAEADADVDPGDDPVKLKERIVALEAELAAMKTTKAEADAAVAEETEKADCVKLVSLAERLRYDTAGWGDTTTSAQRRLDLARHKNLVGADATPEPSVLSGMISALETMSPVAADRADAYAGLRVDTAPVVPEPDKRGDGNDKPPADPFKANLRKRNAATRAANA